MDFLSSRRAVAYLLSVILLAACHGQVRGLSSTADFPSPPVCEKVSFADVLLLEENQCARHGYQTDYSTEDCVSKVLEIDGRTLDKALTSLQSNETFVAVLFYAKWCPFSAILRPKFDFLSIAFPAIRHVAVESSALWPSMLSQHGVHSFPSLFLHNRTVRVRYQGPRATEDLTRFYKDITGLEPVNISYLYAEQVTPIQRPGTGSRFSWSESVGAWLQENLYLALALLFLIFQGLLAFVPKTFAKIKNYWTAQQQTQTAVLRQGFSAILKQKQHEDVSRRNKGKSPLMQENREAGKGVRSVPAWSSSSLAAVTLAEGSSSRVASDDAREIGHVVHRSHLWG